MDMKEDGGKGQESCPGGNEWEERKLDSEQQDRIGIMYAKQAENENNEQKNRLANFIRATKCFCFYVLLLLGICESGS